jgi:hypothetical protein
MMKQIVLICKGAEESGDLRGVLQALFPECEVKVILTPDGCDTGDPLAVVRKRKRMSRW